MKFQLYVQGQYKISALIHLKQLISFTQKNVLYIHLLTFHWKKKTINQISKIKSKKYLIVDDSPYEFGVASQVELLLRKFNPYNIIIENVTRKRQFYSICEKI